MKRMRILTRIMKQTGADHILLCFFIFFAISAVIIWICEPDIPTLRDALWYCYAVITTIGFGDILATTPVARILSVILSAYAVIVISIVTGVIVNYFNQIVQLRQSETLAAVMDKMERLPELSRSELEEISRTVRALRTKR